MEFPGIQYIKGILHFSDVPLNEVVNNYKTPLYVYSEDIILKRIESYKRGIQNYPVQLCYSVKANSNLSIIKIMLKEGLGADIVSGGELFRCIKANMPANKIVFSGVGKTEEEIEYALKEDIMLFSVESISELKKINEIAHSLQKIAPVSIRVNPDIDPKTHPYISTGLKENKFGISSNLFENVVKLALDLKNVELLGFGYHIGSQIVDISSKLEAAEKSKFFIETFKKYKTLKFLDIGGGLGIRYKNENPPEPEEFVRSIISILPWNELKDTTILLEPGRSIIGPAGIFLTKILYIKENYHKLFYIVDGAMNDLIRPSLYQAYHEILPLIESTDFNRNVDIVGPVCETGDFFARDRQLPQLKENDYFAILTTGAYGFVMSSQYNSRPRPAEVLIDRNKKIKLIRKRETYEDLIYKEILI
ncbi:MAG: diaminopimelate decarboxylase [Leptospiraceae bacterium]|nr:MAG: diaminopimelate decarboxylase [Leptospiraceae bacterium]